MSLSLERRRLLKMLGLTTAALMPVFRPGQRVAAAASAVPKRFMAAIMYNGVPFATFWPSEGQATAADVPLAGMDLPAVLKPLEPFKDKLLLIKGIKNAASEAAKLSHIEQTAFSGDTPVSGQEYTPQGPTIDQHIAKLIGTTTKFQSLQFAAMMMGASRPTFATGAQQPLEPMQTPAEAFNRVFADFAPATAPNPVDLDNLRLRKKSILDHVSQDLTAVAGRLDGSDKQKLEAHLAAIRDIEKRVGTSTGGGGASCSKPTLTYQGPACPFRMGSYYAENDPACHAALPDMTKAYMDMIAVAFACDLTRVVGFQWNGHTSGTTYPFLGINEAHHELSHKESDLAVAEKLTKICTWHQEMMAYFYAKLQTFGESDGSTLLDNTISLWTSEIGRGNHTLEHIPITIVGGGGYFKTGRYLNFTSAAGDTKKGSTRSNNDVLVSCANAFGSTVQTFGTPSFCQGPLPGLT